MLTFRADSAGFCDIESGNTARLEGYRSGCRNSLIPANGVLNSPNMAHGCVCGYSLFTSLALIHVPQNEVWSYNALKPGKRSVKRFRRQFWGSGRPHRRRRDAMARLSQCGRSFADGGRQVERRGAALVPKALGVSQPPRCEGGAS